MLSKCRVSLTLASNFFNNSTKVRNSSLIQGRWGSSTCWGVTWTCIDADSLATTLRMPPCVTQAPDKPECPESNQNIADILSINFLSFSLILLLGSGRGFVWVGVVPSLLSIGSSPFRLASIPPKMKPTSYISWFRTTHPLLNPTRISGTERKSGASRSCLFIFPLVDFDLILSTALVRRVYKFSTAVFPLSYSGTPVIVEWTNCS